MKQYRVRMQSNAWYIFHYYNREFSHGEGPFKTYDQAVAAGLASNAANMDEAA